MAPTGQPSKSFKIADLKLREEELKRKAIRHAQLLYYIDELSILTFVLVGIVLSEAIAQRANGKLATWKDLHLDFLNLIVSSIIALITYSSMHIKFKFNDKQKPSYVKRAANALLSGIAWRTIMAGAR